jgi:hypothetical protein
MLQRIPKKQKLCFAFGVGGLQLCTYSEEALGAVEAMATFILHSSDYKR